MVKTQRVLFIAIVMLASVQIAVSQVRLELTAHAEDKRDGQRTTAWAKGCEARIDFTAKEKTYMLLKDCGKTTFAVSSDTRVAVKMPPIQSAPVADINTGALFMQGTPQISIEKLEEKLGPTILGRATTYYRFRAVHRPDPRIQDPVRLIVEEEFWTDATLNIPVLEGLLGKTPSGEAHETERATFAAMTGLPLRHRTVVTIEKTGSSQVQPGFVQEIVSISTEPFEDSLLQIPKDYKVVDMAGNQQ
jgi:hypothetical protein